MYLEEHMKGKIRGAEFIVAVPTDITDVEKRAFFETVSYTHLSSETRGETAFSNLRGLFSDEMEQSFIEGMHSFAKHIPCKRK